MGRGELALLAPVGTSSDSVRRATLGAALLFDLGALALAFEADHALDLGPATALDGVWLLGATARAKFGPVRMGTGVRVPFAPGDDKAFGGIGAPWAQRAADLGVVVDIGLGW